MPRYMTPVSILALLLAAPLAAAPLSVSAEAPVQTQWGPVSEPRWPTTICATLPAAIVSKNGSIDDYDADGRNTHPDHDRLQQAIDACKDGAVKLVRGPKGEDGFLISPIQLKSHVVLWVDKGVTVFASRDPKDYDTGAGDCGTANHEGHKSCRSLFEGRDLDHAGLIGDGKIDARGGSRLLSGPNKGVKSWWDVAWQSKQGFSQHNFRILQTEGGRDFLMYRITFENSPNFHLVPTGDGIIAWNIKILAPSLVYTVPGYACPEGSTPNVNPSATCFTPDTIKNTDGFDPSNASHVLLAYSWISDGDDDVAVKAGGHILSHDQTYAHNHFYYGHGMSLGSETNGGAQHFVIDDLVMDGKDSPEGNGIRLKSDPSRGGPVRDFLFEHVCMKNEAHPLVFDTHYSDKTGTLYPDFKGIVVRDMHYFSGGKYGTGVSTFRGYEDASVKMPVEVTLDTVVWDGGLPGISTGHSKADGTAFAAHITLMGQNSFDKAFTPSDAQDVTVKTIAGSTTALSGCNGAFVPLSAILPDSPI
jgi:polygalacturonase